jgi:hypothetical protein
LWLLPGNSLRSLFENLCGYVVELLCPLSIFSGRFITAAKKAALLFTKFNFSTFFISFSAETTQLESRADFLAAKRYDAFARPNQQTRSKTEQTKQ